MSVCIRTRGRGPLLVEGPVKLYDAAGNEVDLAGVRKLLLCRCGASKTTPLCDGSHNRIGFTPENER